MEKVIKLLNENVVCSIATCCLESHPRVSIMEYVMVDGSPIFTTDKDSCKASNLEENNRISFSVHNMPLFVTIDGTAVKPTEDEISSYNKVLFERHPEFVEMMQQGNMIRFVYYKVLAKKVFYNDYSCGKVPTEIIEL